MATLQTARHIPTITPRPRLKLVSSEASASPALPAPMINPTIVEKLPASAAQPKTQAKHLTDLEQRQLLIQTAALFEGWQLISIQHRASNGILIAYLIRHQETRDPLEMIRDGHALQIMMDGSGNIKVQHPRSKNGHFWQRWWHSLMARLST